MNKKLGRPVGTKRGITPNAEVARAYRARQKAKGLIKKWVAPEIKVVYTGEGYIELALAAENGFEIIDGELYTEESIFTPFDAKLELKPVVGEGYITTLTGRCYKKTN
jgi:hypothetical protein